MRLLITGASGYLGRRLSQLATGRFRVAAGYCSQPDRLAGGEAFLLDLKDPEAALAQILALRPEAIVNAAAISTGGPEPLLQAVNVVGAGVVARAAQELGARLVHVSTDVVHDGRRPPYADDAEPSPLNAYGRSKARAEVEVLAGCPSAAVVRTSLIYGLREMDQSTESFVFRHRAGQPVRLFTDSLRHPIWIDTLAEALLRLVELPFAGRINVAGEERLDRAEYGELLLGWWRESIPVQRVEAASLGLAVPLDLSLELGLAGRTLEMELPGVARVIERHR